MKAADQIFSDRPFESTININKEYLPLVGQFMQSLRLVPRHLPLPKGGCEWYRRGSLYVIGHEAAQSGCNRHDDFVILFILPTGGFYGMIHHGVLYNERFDRDCEELSKSLIW